MVQVRLRVVHRLDTRPCGRPVIRIVGTIGGKGSAHRGDGHSDGRGCRGDARLLRSRRSVRQPAPQHEGPRAQFPSIDWSGAHRAADGEQFPLREVAALLWLPHMVVECASNRCLL